jgi:hypothetical protein
MKLTPTQQKLLFKLAGMKHHQAHHTAETWQKITGIDPKIFGNDLIKITENGGLCIWTAKAEKLYNAKSQKCFNDIQMLAGHSFYASKELF